MSTQRTNKSTPAPQCPACRSTDIRALTGDRHLCGKCGWLVRMVAGRAETFLRPFRPQRT